MVPLHTSLLKSLQLENSFLLRYFLFFVPFWGVHLHTFSSLPRYMCLRKTINQH